MPGRPASLPRMRKRGELYRYEEKQKVTWLGRGLRARARARLGQPTLALAHPSPSHRRMWHQLDEPHRGDNQGTRYVRHARNWWRRACQPRSLEAPGRTCQLRAMGGRTCQLSTVQKIPCGCTRTASLVRVRLRLRLKLRLRVRLRLRLSCLLARCSLAPSLAQSGR